MARIGTSSIDRGTIDPTAAPSGRAARAASIFERTLTRARSGSAPTKNRTTISAPEGREVA